MTQHDGQSKNISIKFGDIKLRALTWVRLGQVRTQQVVRIGGRIGEETCPWWMKATLPGRPIVCIVAEVRKHQSRLRWMRTKGEADNCGRDVGAKNWCKMCMVMTQNASFDWKPAKKNKKNKPKKNKPMLGLFSFVFGMFFWFVFCFFVCFSIKKTKIKLRRYPQQQQ